MQRVRCNLLMPCFFRSCISDALVNGGHSHFWFQSHIFTSCSSDAVSVIPLSSPLTGRVFTFPLCSSFFIPLCFAYDQYSVSCKCSVRWALWSKVSKRSYNQGRSQNLSMGQGTTDTKILALHCQYDKEKKWWFSTELRTIWSINNARKLHLY